MKLNVEENNNKTSNNNNYNGSIEAKKKLVIKSENPLRLLTQLKLFASSLFRM